LRLLALRVPVSGERLTHHLPTAQDHHVEHLVDYGRLGRAIMERVERGPPSFVERDHFAVDHRLLGQGN